MQNNKFNFLCPNCNSTSYIGKTTIGKKSFVGSNVSLVAPIKVGSNALIGAGSVITKDIPNNMLAVERNKQVTIKKRNKK